MVSSIRWAWPRGRRDRRAASRRSGRRAAAAPARRRAAPGRARRARRSRAIRARFSVGAARAALLRGQRAQLAQRQRQRRTPADQARPARPPARALVAAPAIAARPSRVVLDVHGRPSVSAVPSAYDELGAAYDAWCRVGHRGHRLVRRARPRVAAVRCSRSASDRAGWRFPRRSPAIHVVGVDNSPGMLELAAAQGRAAGSGVELHRGGHARPARPRDVSAGDGARSARSCICATDDERLAVLRSLRDRLAPGGTLAFDVFHPHPLDIAETHDRWLEREPGIHERARWDAAERVARADRPHGRRGGHDGPLVGDAERLAPAAGRGGVRRDRGLRLVRPQAAVGRRRPTRSGSPGPPEPRRSAPGGSTGGGAPRASAAAAAPGTLRRRRTRRPARANPRRGTSAPRRSRSAGPPRRTASASARASARSRRPAAPSAGWRRLRPRAKTTSTAQCAAVRRPSGRLGRPPAAPSTTAIATSSRSGRRVRSKNRSRAASAGVGGSRSCALADGLVERDRRRRGGVQRLRPGGLRDAGDVVGRLHQLVGQPSRSAPTSSSHRTGQVDVPQRNAGVRDQRDARAGPRAGRPAPSRSARGTPRPSTRARPCRTAGRSIPRDSADERRAERTGGAHDRADVARDR